MLFQNTVAAGRSGLHYGAPFMPEFGPLQIPTQLFEVRKGDILN